MIRYLAIAALVAIFLPAFAHDASAGDCTVNKTKYGCGEYDANAKYKGGGYHPKMVMTTVCLPNDIWKAILVNGRGHWNLNFAYPRVRKNEKISTVREQCVTRLMPANQLAAAYIRCHYYTGPMAVEIAGGGGPKTMRRRPDMES